MENGDQHPAGDVAGLVERLRDGADRFLKWVYEKPYSGPSVISIPTHRDNIDMLLQEAADALAALTAGPVPEEVEKVRAKLLAGDFSEDDLGGDVGTMSLRNPDGIEAVGLIDAQAAQIAALQRAVATVRELVDAGLRGDPRDEFDRGVRAARLSVRDDLDQHLPAVETGWLIELKPSVSATPSWYCGGYEDCFTTDSLKAIRYARASDAQKVIDDIGWTEAFPTEHQWTRTHPADAADREA